MKVMLNNRHGVHGAHEQRQEHQPMVERRAVQVVGEPASEQEAGRDLNERFHGTILA
jgi:hypothetical protein